LSIANCQLTIWLNRANRFSPIDNREPGLAIDNRQSAIGNRQSAMLHDALVLVRKEVSIARFAPLTKLYIPLTDSLRPF